MFPAYLLSKLYIAGSLHNTPQGFELRLKNVIDSGTLVGIGPLGVDEGSIAVQNLTVAVGDKSLSGDQLSRTQPMYVRAMQEIVLRVAGDALPAGTHKISLQVFTAEAGKLQFSVSDTIPA
jgi:hypothetical protein